MIPLFNHPLFLSSIHLSVPSSIHPSVYNLSIYLSPVHPLIQLFIHPHVSYHLSVHSLSIHVSTHPSQRKSLECVSITPLTSLTPAIFSSHPAGGGGGGEKKNLPDYPSHRKILTHVSLITDHTPPLLLPPSPLFPPSQLSMSGLLLLLLPLADDDNSSGRVFCSHQEL